MAEYIDTKDAAKLLRKALKRAFPAAKFSVRISRYSGGSSIDVGYTDGPKSADVEAVASQYQGKNFDGMIDMEYSSNAWLCPDGTVAFAETRGTGGSRGSVPDDIMAPPHPDARLVRFPCYVFVHRDYSENAEMLAVAKFQEEWGQEYVRDKDYCGNGSALWGDTILCRIKGEMAF